MTPVRGGIWRYAPAVVRPGQSALRLVVSAEAVNAGAALPVVLAVHLVDSDPGGLLAVAIDGYGWAAVLTVEPVLRSRLVEPLGVADPTALDAIDAALRAALDL